MGIARYDADDDPDAPFAEDRWELYHVAEDPSEAHDLAASHPDKLRELQDLWWREAGRYGVLPLHARRLFAPGRPPSVRRRDRVSLVPGAAAVPEEVAPDTKLRPHSIVAWFDVPAGGAEGVLVAQGGRFGGYSLFVQDGRVRYASNFAGVEVVTIESEPELGPGAHVAAVALDTAPGPRHAGRAVRRRHRRRAARSLGRRRTGSLSPVRGCAAATTTGRRCPSATSRRTSSRGRSTRS